MKAEMVSANYTTEERASTLASWNETRAAGPVHEHSGIRERNLIDNGCARYFTGDGGRVKIFLLRSATMNSLLSKKK